MTKMKPICAATILLVMLALATPGYAQLDLFSREQRIEFTPDWHGDSGCSAEKSAPIPLRDDSHQCAPWRFTYE
jgi:hypothetical protein